MGGSGGLPDGGSPEENVCDDAVCPDGLACVELSGTVSCQCPDESCSAPSTCSDTPCDDAASCVDLVEGFVCRCEDGFEGNGLDCVEVHNLCEGVVCTGSNMQCVSNGAAGICECLAGYEMSAGGCRDINECDVEGACGSGEECTNLAGGHSCDCRPGYSTSDDVGCVNVNECEVGIDRCDSANGNCSDGDDGYVCMCDAGSFGDGYFCDGSDACSPNPCRNGGECTPTPGSYSCICPLGSAGDSCQDSTTCSLDTVLNQALNPLVEDPVVRQALHELTGIAAGMDITVADLQGYTSLSLPPIFSASDPQATSLAGLECWASLESLTVNGHQISDLNPISRLGALSSLDIGCTEVTDLTPIASLVQLRELRDARYEVLCPTRPKLTSAAALSNHVGLEILDLSGHALSTLAGIKSLPRLGELLVADNSLTSSSEFAVLHNLHTVVAGENSFTDISGFGTMQGLRSLSLVAVGVSDISSLSGLSQLTHLRLGSNSISDVSALSGLFALAEIELSFNSIVDISPLAGLYRATDLSLGGNEVEDLGVLAMNPDFGQQGGRLNVNQNPLDCKEQRPVIRELEARGIRVASSCD